MIEAYGTTAPRNKIIEGKRKEGGKKRERSKGESELVVDNRIKGKGTEMIK